MDRWQKAEIKALENLSGVKALNPLERLSEASGGLFRFTGSRDFTIAPVENLPGGGQVHESFNVNRWGELSKGHTTTELPGGSKYRVDWSTEPRFPAPTLGGLERTVGKVSDVALITTAGGVTLAVDYSIGSPDLSRRNR